MKRFRIFSILIVSASCLVAVLNAYYLVTLYQSIRENMERDVKCAIADMDIDEMWCRAIAFNTGRLSHKTLKTDLNRNCDSIVSHYRDEHGEHHVLNSKAIAHDVSYTNQIVVEMSNQMHGLMDGLIPVNTSVSDSILTRRLSERGIEPDFVAVEVIDINDSIVVVINPKLRDGRAGKDVFTMVYDNDRGLAYRIYLSPLAENIFEEMSGVIVTTVLLILIFAIGFCYLHHTVRKLKSIEEMKDDFTNNMTHELKTPIAIAYSANDAILNHSAGTTDDKTKRYLGIALEQLTRLNGLVENILSMSMERRRSMAFSPERINVREFVRELSEHLLLKTVKPCRICTDGIPEELTIVADPTHFGNILTNLIDNSVKYSGSSVDINIEASESELSVTDNGIGIPQKNLPHIFEKFYRVPHGNQHDVRGYGIGLYYVKSVVERMGWSIEVTSREGNGTKFTLKFGHDYEEQNTSCRG